MDDRVVEKVTKAILRVHLDFENRRWARPTYETIARVAILNYEKAMIEEARNAESA